MFNKAKVYPAYKHLIGFKEHYDTAEIDIDDDLVESESGETYQDAHAAIRLDYIKATLPTNYTLNKYLNDKKEAAVTTMINDLIRHRQLSGYGKTLLEQAQLLNRPSWMGDKIVNQNRFVGFQIKLKDITALNLILNEIGLQLDGAQTITLYLFHTSKEDAIETYDITTTDTSTKWSAANLVLSTMVSEEYHGGAFVLGYYQEDLTTSAVNYANFNWDIGECAGCSGSAGYYQIWRSVANHFYVFPIYVPSVSLRKDEGGQTIKGKMFELSKAIYDNGQSWGLNLKVSVVCDLTEFLIQNRMQFIRLLKLKVSLAILQDMKFCQETNFIEESLKMMIVHDLDGSSETKQPTLAKQYADELKAVAFNISGINDRCLSCESEAYRPVYGVV